MTTTIGGLPAATAGNITDSAHGFEFEDATVTNVRVTVAQLRVALSNSAQTFFGNLTAVGTVHELQTSNGNVAVSDVSTTNVVNQVTSNSGKGAYLTFIEDTVANRGAIGFDAASGTLTFRTGSSTGTVIATLTSAGIFEPVKQIVAPAGATAGFHIVPGGTPSPLVDGDMWVTGSGLFVRIAGSTVGPLS